jgi:hypothetical protein
VKPGLSAPRARFDPGCGAARRGARARRVGQRQGPGRRRRDGPGRGHATRVGYLDQVAAGEKRAIDTLTVARMDAKIRANAAEAARQRADAARDAARDALADTKAAAATAEKAANDVQNLVTERQKALDVANQERSAVLARYQDLKAESDRIAAERAGDLRGRRQSGGHRRPVRRVRLRHLYLARPVPGQRPGHLLRPPVGDRGIGRAVGTPRAGHRSGRLDRLVPALRGTRGGDPVDPVPWLPGCFC